MVQGPTDARIGTSLISSQFHQANSPSPSPFLHLRTPQSGLLTAYFSTPPTHRLTLPQVESRVIAYLARHHIHNYAVMAGAGIGFDRGMVVSCLRFLSTIFCERVGNVY
jgi:hypothetical protein